MTLLENFVEITCRWRRVFPPRRSHRRAIDDTPLHKSGRSIE